MVATRKSSILGPDGLPIEVALLDGEQAAPQAFGQRALTYYSEASGLTPERLAEIMRGANVGLARPYLTLAIDMEERYMHYFSQLQTRRLAFDGVPCSVSAPKGVNSATVDAVQSLVESPIFADLCQDLLDAVSKGYSVVEPAWDYKSKLLQPVKYQHRDPRYFRYDPVGLDDLCLLDDSGLAGEHLQRPYFIKHEPRVRAGIPIRRGLARTVAWGYMVQQFTLQDWSAFAEIYGVPFRLGKFHPNATLEDKMTLLRAVRGLANDAAGIIPSGMDIEFHETNGARGEQVFGNLISYIDRNVSKAVVGQTMTAEDGSSLGQAKVHNEVRHDILRSDARQLSSTINRDLIEPFIAMNFGPQDVYPIVMFEVAEPEDVKSLADALGKVVPLGLKVGQKQVRKRLSLPEPDEDEECLGPKAAALDAPDYKAPAKVPSKADQKALEEDAQQRADKGKATLSLKHQPCACPACGATAQLAAEAVDDVTAIDETDALVIDALDDYQEITDPLLMGLLSAVNGSASFDEVLAKLEKAKIDSGPLARKLAIATAKARGLGDVKD